jgi:hypothetical protein
MEVNGSLAKNDCLMMPRRLITPSGCLCPRAQGPVGEVKMEDVHRRHLAKIPASPQLRTMT